MFRPGLDTKVAGTHYQTSNPHSRRGLTTSLNSYNNSPKNQKSAMDMDFNKLMNSAGNLLKSPNIFHKHRTAQGQDHLQTQQKNHLPNIVKQTQTPQMKAFVSQTTKNIKFLKERHRSQQSSPHNSSMLRQHNVTAIDIGGPEVITPSLMDSTGYRYLYGIGPTALGEIKSHILIDNDNHQTNLTTFFRAPHPGLETVNEEQIYNQTTHSKFKQRLSCDDQNSQNFRSTKHSPKQNLEGGPVDNETVSPQTAGTNRTQGGLKAIYHSTQARIIPQPTVKSTFSIEPVSVSKKQNPNSLLQGTKCLNPVSENEDLQLKAAMVNMRKLKLDIDMKEQHSTVKKDSTLELKVYTAEQMSVGTLDHQQLGQGSLQSVLNQYGNCIQLPDIGSTQRIELSDPYVLSNKAVQKIKEFQLPESTDHSQVPFKYTRILKGALPARENPMTVIQNQKMQSLVNFTKYKQLKRYNESLMRMQQELIQAYKDAQKASKTKLQMSPITLVAAEDQEQQSIAKSIEQFVETGKDQQVQDERATPELSGDGTGNQVSIERNESQIEVKIHQNKVLGEPGVQSDFQFGHHKFVPKKQIHGTKKSLVTDYRKSLMEEKQGINDAALKIGQANLKDRYQIIVKTYEISDEQQQVSPSTMLMPPKNDESQQDSLQSSSIGQEKSAEIKVVINDEMLLQDQKRANREKFETLPNLALQSVRMSSNLTSDDQSSIAAVINPPTVTQVQVPAEGVYSASSNRVIVLHKQGTSSSPRGKEQQSPQPVYEDSPQRRNSKIRLSQHQYSHMRSKSTILENSLQVQQLSLVNADTPTQVTFQIRQFREGVAALQQQNGSSPQTQKNKATNLQDKIKQLKQHEELLKSIEIQLQNQRTVQEQQVRKMNEPQSKTKHVLKVNSDIYKDLEQLRQVKAQKNGERLDAAANITPIPIMGETDKFFHTEVGLTARTQPMRTLNDITFNQLGEDRSRPKEVEEFSLNFPMRNSRLSQAVMASLQTIDANSKKSIDQSGKNAIDSINKQDQVNPSSVKLVSPLIMPSSLVLNENQLQVPNQAVGSLQVSPRETTDTARIQQTQDNETVQFDSIFEIVATTRDFLESSYFKEQPEFFKDEELKQRMALVRKAVAQLEREHFNLKKKQQRQKDKEVIKTNRQ